MSDEKREKELERVLHRPEEVEEKTAEEMARELDAALNEEDTGKKKKKRRKKWSRKKKITVAVCGAAVLFLVGNMALGGNKDKGVMVMTMPLTKGEVVDALSLSGPVSGTDSVDVVSNLHAEILELPVKEGDKVEKDQLLAILDSSDIQKEVDVAQNSYDLAVSTYNETMRDSQNAYEKALQDYNTAKLNYDRQQALFAAGDISQLDLETASNTLNDAARQMNTYTVVKGRVVPDKSDELKIKNAQFELEQKQKDLENTRIKSPISGTVVRVNCKVGRFADKTEDEKPIFIVENLDNLELEIKVSEYSIGKIRIGQKAAITADILDGETVSGEVIAISPTGEEKGNGSTERVIPITIRIDGTSSKLIAGITAKAEIVTERAENAFKVPASSLIQNGDGTTSIAVVNADNTISLIPVTTGVESDFEVEIQPAGDKALEDNMSVVSNPDPGMTDGMAVVVLNAGM